MKISCGVTDKRTVLGIVLTVSATQLDKGFRLLLYLGFLVIHCLRSDYVL
ncbi:hypothetical protein [Nitrosomonas supralitoralis]|nr:hypothetical protein [Nitrosomonas supralitoralis]